MSDRSPVTLTIYAVPDTREARAAIFDVIEENDFTIYADTDGVALGEAIIADDVSLGADSEIAEILTEHGITFDVFQDAKYEYDGSGIIFVPGLGTFSYVGGTSGTTMVEAREVDALVKTHEADPVALSDALAKLTGRAWRERIEALVAAMPDDQGERLIVADREEEE